MKCPDLFVDDGLRIVSGWSTSMGSVWNFSCPLGYDLQGQTSMNCLPDGRWSDSLPSCDIVRCPHPLIEDESLQELSVDIFFAGKAEYVCQRGFVLLGTPVLTCKIDGTWSNVLPSCQGKLRRIEYTKHLLLFIKDAVLCSYIYCRNNMSRGEAST